MERTFAMIKSHAYRETDAILEIIKASGFVIETAVTEPLPPDMIEGIYAEHVGRPYWPNLRRSVEGQVTRMILVRDDAVTRWRALIGSSDPTKAAPGTIRAQFGNKAGPMAENAVHGSDSVASAEREIAIAFLNPALEALVEQQTTADANRSKKPTGPALS